MRQRQRQRSLRALKMTKRVVHVSIVSRESTARKRRTNCFESHKPTTSIRRCEISRASIFAGHVPRAQPIAATVSGSPVVVGQP